MFSLQTIKQKSDHQQVNTVNIDILFWLKIHDLYFDYSWNTIKIWISNTSNVHLSWITDWDEILPNHTKCKSMKTKGKGQIIMFAAFKKSKFLIMYNSRLFFIHSNRILSRIKNPHDLFIPFVLRCFSQLFIISFKRKQW